MRGSILALLAVSALPLGGCVAAVAAGAVGAVARSAEPRRDPSIDVGPAAAEACTARAAQHGAVHIIDIERRGPGKAIVWGTVGDEGARRSFECRFDGRIVGFTLREIKR
jgi:hypothetical protein